MHSSGEPYIAVPRIMFEEMMSVQIHDATPNDDDGVRQVQQRTWLATYPNAELGITKEDIEARFHDSSEEAIRRRQAQQQTINLDPLVHLWVAKEAERIVGFCLAKKEGMQNRIHWIVFSFLPSCVQRSPWPLLLRARRARSPRRSPEPAGSRFRALAALLSLHHT